MPYVDTEQAKNYQRTYRRIRRAGDDCTTPGQTQVPVELRLQTASDVLELFGEQSNGRGPSAAWRERLLKAIELCNVAARLESLETALNVRSKN